jgi:hypothetical protein
LDQCFSSSGLCPTNGSSYLARWECTYIIVKFHLLDKEKLCFFTMVSLLWGREGGNKMTTGTQNVQKVRNHCQRAHGRCDQQIVN